MLFFVFVIEPKDFSNIFLFDLLLLIVFEMANLVLYTFILKRMFFEQKYFSQRIFFLKLISCFLSKI